MVGRPRIRVTRSWVWPSITGTLVIILVAAGAATAIETDTVSSYSRGLWWSISLVTTTGFIGAPPRTDGGAALSVVLMVVGFLLLALVSASFAAVFVRDEERPRDLREQLAEDAMVASLRGLEARLASIENQLTGRTAGDVPASVEETDSLPGTESTP
ncbi:MAG: potassium channel family protein [Dermatophilaceae bacterium]